MHKHHNKNRLRDGLQNARFALLPWWPQAGTWRRVLIGFLAFVFILVTLMFSIAQWYIHTQRNQSEELGVSFIPAYAESLGLDPQETMDALLGLGVKH